MYQSKQERLVARRPLLTSLALPPAAAAAGTGASAGPGGVLRGTAACPGRLAAFPSRAGKGSMCRRCGLGARAGSAAVRGPRRTRAGPRGRRPLWSLRHLRHSAPWKGRQVPCSGTKEARAAGDTEESPRPRWSRAAELGRASWAGAAGGGGQGTDPVFLRCSCSQGQSQGQRIMWGGDWGEESLGRGKDCFPCVSIYLSQCQNR